LRVLVGVSRAGLAQFGVRQNQAIPALK